MCLVRNELGNKISAPFTLFSYIKGRKSNVFFDIQFLLDKLREDLVLC